MMDIGYDNFCVYFEGILSKSTSHLTKHMQNALTGSGKTCLTEYGSPLCIAPITLNSKSNIWKCSHLTWSLCEISPDQKKIKKNSNDLVPHFRFGEEYTAAKQSSENQNCKDVFLPGIYYAKLILTWYLNIILCPYCVYYG